MRFARSASVLAGLFLGAAVVGFVTASPAAGAVAQASDPGARLAAPQDPETAADEVAAVTETAIVFPGSAAIDDGDTVRFRFVDPHLNGLPIYGANGGDGLTYIWRVWAEQQSGYYTGFFWSNDGTLFWDPNDPGAVDSYYGFHPYPKDPPSGNTHSWEIAVNRNDYVNGTVQYGRWYIQAARVFRLPNGNPDHEYYFDLPNTSAAYKVEREILNPDYGRGVPPNPALTFGDAPWVPGREVWKGKMRGFQIYNSLLSVQEILDEVNEPLSTAAGAASIWYLNLNPTPTDISDKSGRGNHPEWVGDLRPTLSIETGEPPPLPPAPTDLEVAR